MSNKGTATIRAEDSPISIRGAMLSNPDDPDEGSVLITFAVNSDVSVPKFWSAEKGLTLLLDTFPAGFDSFRGNIGGGKIFIKTTQGITIKGSIQGGPPEDKNFVGSGTWIRV